MADLKMNTLHIHATDDEGWRLEIPDLPELTTFGAYRCESGRFIKYHIMSNFHYYY